MNGDRSSYPRHNNIIEYYNSQCEYLSYTENQKQRLALAIQKKNLKCRLRFFLCNRIKK